MLKINPNKLLHSKWTAVTPVNKEKHFIVIRLVHDAQETVTHCEIEAVYSKRSQVIAWQNLKDNSSWLQGWK